MSSTKTYDSSTGMELLEPSNSDLMNVLFDIRNADATLDALAEQINDAAHQTEKAKTNAVEGALITGALLIRAKEQVPHGQWDAWVTANCEVALRTAQAYMRLAKTVPQLDDSNTQRVALLPLREALKAIATDPTAPPKPRYTNIRATKKTDSEKAVSVFSKAEHALKASKRLIGMRATVKGTQVNDLRKKLNDVLAELDGLEAAAETGSAK